MNFEQFNEWSSASYLNNTVKEYAIALGTLIGLMLFFMIIKRFISYQLHRLAVKTNNDFDDFLADLIKQIGTPVFLVVSLYIATLPLTLEDTVRSVVYYAFVIVLTIRAICLLQDISKYSVTKAYRKARPDDVSADTMIRNITNILQWAIWALGAVFVLDNLGINISALMAGLGIGGIAIAMASQAVLGDAFSALSIFVDKPFEVGDFIIIDNLMGSVEHVGLKTTRIRSLHGEQLIFANSDLTKSRIQNYKRMQTRRIPFQVGVVYQTTAEQVRKIPELVKDIISKIEGVRIDRVHFKSFGDFALMFEIVYYVLSPDYNVYMNKQQEINFALKDVFEKEGIEFAYPTQTLLVNQEK